MVKYDQSKTNDSAIITEVKPAREPSMKFDTTFLFGNLGDVIELNAWVPADIIEQIDALNSDPSKILRSREADDYQGPKEGCEYNHIPEGWDLPDHATTLGSLIYNRGQYLYPHRDKFRKVTPEGIYGDSFRLINHINHTSSTEFHFVVDGKIFKPEPRRWYAINTRKVHYGFSFVDGVYHLSAALGLEDRRREATVKWLLEKLPFAVDFQADRKGVDCGRN
mgnify:FL=1